MAIKEEYILIRTELNGQTYEEILEKIYQAIKMNGCCLITVIPPESQELQDKAKELDVQTKAYYKPINDAIKKAKQKEEQICQK